MDVTINSRKKLRYERKGNQLFIDGKEMAYHFELISPTKLKLFREKSIYNIELIERNDGNYRLAVNGQELILGVTDHMTALLEELGMSAVGTSQVKEIKAPMPGTILDILAKPGDTVAKGDQVLILEAMKMENVIKSPGEGVIAKIKVEKGDNVEKNELLISFE